MNDDVKYVITNESWDDNFNEVYSTKEINLYACRVFT